MERESRQSPVVTMEGHRVLQQVGSVYDATSTEGWAWGLKLLAARGLEQLRERAEAVRRDP